MAVHSLQFLFIGGSRLDLNDVYVSIYLALRLDASLDEANPLFTVVSYTDINIMTPPSLPVPQTSQKYSYPS